MGTKRRVNSRKKVVMIENIKILKFNLYFKLTITLLLRGVKNEFVLWI